MIFRIRPAGPADVPALMALRAEAEKWLHTLGTDQWSDPETGSRAIAKWHSSIADGRSWAVTSPTGDVVGTISRDGPDRDFWHESDALESALYVYKLIVGRGQAGAGLGELMLDWACRLAALEGRTWVRLDCWRDNPALHRYYEQRGFQHVRTELHPHRKSGWLGQRPAALLTSPDNCLIPASQDARVSPALRG